MTFSNRVLSVTMFGMLAACRPSLPEAPKAEPAEADVTVDASGANPVFNWKRLNYKFRVAQVVVASTDCAAGPRGELMDNSVVRVEGGKEHIMYWLLSEHPDEGFDGPIVFGSNVPGAKINGPVYDVKGGCTLVAEIQYSSGARAKSNPFKLTQSTSHATADTDMKRLGYDKPWVTSKTEKALPAPNPELQAAFAGTYQLQAVNGKPLPFKYPNNCALTGTQYAVAADGTYSSGYTMECAGKPVTTAPTNGKYGVTATNAAFAGDPDSEPAVRDTDGEGFTRKYGGDTYTFKRTAKP